MLLTLRGTPTLYYGDEIGMADVDIPPSQRHDPQGLRGGASRDPERTPMRWDASAYAGFSDAQPWLPIGPAAGTVNVAVQRDDDRSMLSLHRRLIQLRRRETALSVGEFHALGRQGNVLAYVRSDGEREFGVALNLGSTPAAMEIGRRGAVAISTLPGRDGAPIDGTVELAADEGVVIELEPRPG